MSSTSVAEKLTSTAVSSAVVTVTSSATGTSLTLVTVTVIVDWLESVPVPSSVTVYVKLSVPK